MVIQRPNVKFFIFAHKMALVVSVNIHSYVPMEQFLIKNILFVIGGLMLTVLKLKLLLLKETVPSPLKEKQLMQDWLKKMQLLMTLQ